MSPAALKRRTAWWQDKAAAASSTLIAQPPLIRLSVSHWWQRHDTILCGIAAATTIPLAIAYSVAHGYALPLIGAIILAGALALAIHNWRWSIYGLLLYLPFAGIPIIALYPHTQIPVLAKDFLFTLPAYAGFVLTAKRPGWGYRGAPVFLLGSLAVLVAGEVLNPQLPRLLIGLIGLKVWLLYVPLLFLGYHLISTKRELARALKVLMLVALIPAGVGIAEAVLFHTGHRDTVYALYGSAATAVTQRFAHTDYEGGGFLLRVPSTFSFVTQYYVFTTTMVAVAFAAWRLRGGRAWAVVWAIMVVACATSGARGAFLMMPLLIVMVVLLDAASLRAALGRSAMPLLLTGAGLLSAFALFGSSAGVVFSHALSVGTVEFNGGFLQSLADAVHVSKLGMGTGMNTEAARYAFDNGSAISAWGGLANESWWIKVFQELGVAGVVIVLSLFLTIAYRAYANHRRLQDPGLRAVSAALLGLLVWNMFYLTKGMYIDVDPLNVYFWLFAGILARIPTLESTLT